MTCVVQHTVFCFVHAWTECAPCVALQWSVANKPVFISKTFLLWIIHDLHINSTPDSQAAILAKPWHDACLYRSSEHHQRWASLWVPNPLFVTCNLKTFWLDLDQIVFFCLEFELYCKWQIAYITVKTRWDACVINCSACFMFIIEKCNCSVMQWWKEIQSDLIAPLPLCMLNSI